MNPHIVKLVVAIVLLTQGMLSALPAQSAPLVIKAGTVCKAKGSVVMYKNIKFTCIASGKKLIWNKGVALSKAQILAAAELKAQQEAKTAAAKAAEELKAKQEAEAAAAKAAAELKVQQEAEAAAAKAAEELKAKQEAEAQALAARLVSQKPAVQGLSIGNLLWNEDFLGGAGASLDASKWSARNCHRTPQSNGGGACFGSESVYYAPSAVKLDGSSDGVAVISTNRINGPLPLDAGSCLSDSCSFVSARFDTAGKVAFKYGYIEARIKMPVGSGNHPAFWMLGDNINSVGWPLSGEMDITEIHGINPYATTSATHYSTINSPNTCCNNHFYSVGSLNVNADVSAEYHLYSLAWLPDSISYYVDGRLIYSTTPSTMSPSGIWSFNQKFFLIFNNAVNSEFSGSWANLQSSTMSIDWVRSYQLNGQGEVFTQ